MKRTVFLLICLLLLAAACNKSTQSTTDQNQSAVNIQNCLSSQKEEYKPGFEGEPTRVPNKCEIYAKIADPNSIQILIKSQDAPTLIALTENPNAPREIYNIVYERKDVASPWHDDIATALARNPNSPKEVLIKILKEKGGNVVLYFGENILKIQDDILGLESYYLQKFPLTTVSSGSSDRNYFYNELLRQLVLNPKTSEEALQTIIKRNYNIFINQRTLSQIAQENLNNRVK